AEGGAMRVRAILDHREAVLAGERQDRIHVDRESIEMDHEDRARPRSDQRLQVLWIRTEIFPTNVHGHRPRTDVDDRLDRRYERVRLDQNLVVRTNTSGTHTESQGVGSRRHALRVLRPDEASHLGFEGAQFLAAQQLHAIEYTLARAEQFSPNAAVFAAQLDHPNPGPRARLRCGPP